LYVDASFSYLMIILLNDFNHPKNLSTRFRNSYSIFSCERQTS
jgi:hypothetical protein